MLKTENPKNADKALTAFRLQRRTRKKSLGVVFEHGQLWILDNESGAIWSVVDAEGGNSVKGFDFEQIEHGDEE